MPTLYYESAPPKVMEISEEEFHSIHGCTSVKISIGYFDYSSSTYFTYDRSIAEKFFIYWRTPDEERELLDYPVSFNIKDELRIWWKQHMKFSRKLRRLKEILRIWFTKFILRKIKDCSWC